MCGHVTVTKNKLACTFIHSSFMMNKKVGISVLVQWQLIIIEQEPFSHQTSQILHM